jgi:hypothetical protein
VGALPLQIGSPHRKRHGSRLALKLSTTLI